MTVVRDVWLCRLCEDDDCVDVIKHIGAIIQPMKWQKCKSQ